MTFDRRRVSYTACALLALAGCGEKSSAPAATPATEPAPAPAAPAAPAAPPPSVELPAIPEGAKVSFVEPADGAKVQGPLVNGKVSVPIKMGAENILVKPAGQIEAGSGHHHVLIDSPPDAEGTVVNKNETHIHYGQGQTEATLELTPGEHTLQLQFADGIHRSYGPKLASTIKIVVAEGTPGVTATTDDKAKPGTKKATEKPAAAHKH